MEWVKLGDIAEIRTGKLDANAAIENGKYPFFTTSKEILRINDYTYDDEVVLVAGNGDLNVKYFSGKFNAYQRTYILTKKKNKAIDMRYLYYFLSKYIEVLRRQSIGGVIKYIKLSNLTEALVPLLDYEEQEIVINKFNCLEELITKRREQIDALDALVGSVFDSLFKSKEGRPVKLHEHVRVDTNMINDFSKYSNYDYVGIKNIETISGKLIDVATVGENNPISGKYVYDARHVLYSKIRPNLNKVALPSRPGLLSADAYPLLPNDEIDRIYLAFLLRSNEFLSYAEKHSSRTNIPKINKKQLGEFRFHLPPIALQNRFADYVTSIEAQKESLRSSLSELETLFDALMQAAFSGHLN